VTIDKMLISSSPGERRIALVERTRLVELVTARPDLQSFVGNIYLGRVERVVPGIQAAFVAIGHERSGFLAVAEARPHGDNSGGDIGDYLGEGDAVLVQAQRDPFEGKGAKLTAHITLPGRFLVYTPDHDDIKLSRRIDNEEDRARLRGLIKERAGDGGGFIVRTSAVKAADREVVGDIDYLRAVWREIEQARAGARPPVRLYRDLDPALQVLRDEGTPEIRRIVTDDPQVLAEIREFCGKAAPDMVSRIELHDGSGDMFEDHGIEEQIERALAPSVNLASGGDIIISETAALCAIDVNIGAGAEKGAFEDAALAVNLEAADEIARQIRLRNLSGLIIIDFVAMKRRESGAMVLDRLRKATATDSCPVYVVGFTNLGLVEMTRPRRRDSLSHSLGGRCPSCAGAGYVKSPLTVAHEALRAAGREAMAHPGAGLEVRAAAEVIETLNGRAKSARKEAEDRLGRPLRLVIDAALAPDRFVIAPRSNKNG